jgi:hypothetical protein
MAVTVSQYNHTARLFAEGSISASDQFKLLLATSATFDATNTAISGISYTEPVDGGYTSGGQALTNVTVTTTFTDDAKFDADNVVWTAVGTLTASYGILYNVSAANAPLVFINFGTAESAGPGTDFIVTWAASGIFSFIVS